MTGEPGRDDDELQALKQGSVDRYGAEIATAEEQKAASDFYTLDPDHPDAKPDLTDARERTLLKAVLDEALHDRGDPEAAVPARDVERRARDYLDVDLAGSTAKLWDLVDHVPADHWSATSRPGRPPCDARRAVGRGSSRRAATSAPAAPAIGNC